MDAARPRWSLEVWGVMSLFFLQAVMLGHMLVRIPDIKQATGVNKAELAIGLIGAPSGAMLMLPFAGAFAARLGVRKTLLVGFPAFALSTVAIGTATSLESLFVAMLLMGLSLAFTELGLNVHASNVERHQGLLIMGRAHGFWTLGEMSGSLAGVAMGFAGISVLGGGFTCAILSLPPALAVVFTLRKEKRISPVDPGPRRFRLKAPAPVLVGIGALLLGMAMAEGAASEWSALYMSELLEEKSASAGYAFSVFAAALAAMRFSCDWLKARLGAVRLVRLSALVAMLGLGLIVAHASAATAFVGFALLGVGVAAAFPLAMSAAGHIPGKTTSHIAFLSFMAIVAFMVGPVMIGFLAELTELRWGLAALFPLLLLCLACAGTLRVSEKK